MMTKKDTITGSKLNLQSMYIYIPVIIIVLLDQISKFIVKKSMYLYESIEVFGDFFRLTYIENPGMAFGIQLESKFLFTILSVCAAIIVLIYLIRLPNERLLFRFSLSLILGGAIGNLIDRLIYGKVIDFLDVEFFNISIPKFQFLFIDFPGYQLTRWPVFNIADSAVSCGMVLITWMILFQKPPLTEEISN
jgi:signal peptidase II